MAQTDQCIVGGHFVPQKKTFGPHLRAITSSWTAVSQESVICHPGLRNSVPSPIPHQKKRYAVHPLQLTHKGGWSGSQTSDIMRKTPGSDNLPSFSFIRLFHSFHSPSVMYSPEERLHKTPPNWLNHKYQPANVLQLYAPTPPEET